MSETAVRKRAARQGLALRKSRSRTPEHPNYGGFIVMETAMNVIACSGLGSSYISLEECAEYIDG